MKLVWIMVGVAALYVAARVVVAGVIAWAVRKFGGGWLG